MIQMVVSYNTYYWARLSRIKPSAASVAFVSRLSIVLPRTVKCGGLDSIDVAMLSELMDGMYACRQASAISRSLSSSQRHMQLVDNMLDDPVNFSAK
jgi:hypothetical protein